MRVLQSPLFRQLALSGSLGAIAVLTGVRIVAYEQSPWDVVVAFAIGSVLVFGPLTWIIRGRISGPRRDQLSYVAAGLALFCLPVVLGIGLLAGGLLVFLDSFVFGSILGLAIASLIERTPVPDRFRNTA